VYGRCSRLGRAPSTIIARVRRNEQNAGELQTGPRWRSEGRTCASAQVAKLALNDRLKELCSDLACRNHNWRRCKRLPTTMLNASSLASARIAMAAAGTRKQYQPTTQARIPRYASMRVSHEASIKRYNKVGAHSNVELTALSAKGRALRRPQARNVSRGRTTSPTPEVYIISCPQRSADRAVPPLRKTDIGLNISASRHLVDAHDTFTAVAFCQPTLVKGGPL